MRRVPLAVLVRADGIHGYSAPRWPPARRGFSFSRSRSGMPGPWQLVALRSPSLMRDMASIIPLANEQPLTARLARIAIRKGPVQGGPGQSLSVTLTRMSEVTRSLGSRRIKEINAKPCYR
jgi:hypothetical protein